MPILRLFHLTLTQQFRRSTQQLAPVGQVAFVRSIALSTLWKTGPWNKRGDAVGNINNWKFTFGCSRSRQTTTKVIWKSFQNDEEWRLFYCDSTLGCRVIQDFVVAFLQIKWLVTSQCEHKVMWSNKIWTTIISWVRRGEIWLPGFNVKTTVLSGATFVVSNGNNNGSRASPTMEARQILKRQRWKGSMLQAEPMLAFFCLIKIQKRLPHSSFKACL